MEESVGDKAYKFGFATGAFAKSLFFFIQNVATLAITFLTLFIILLSLYLFSMFTLRYGHTIVRDTEYFMRCELYPDGKPILKLLSAVKTVYNYTTCWTNSLGLISRLFSTKFLISQTLGCVESTKNFLNILDDVAKITSIFFIKTTEWIFTNPFTHTYPVYPVFAGLYNVMVTTREVLDCLCEVLSPLWKIITEILKDRNLYCFLSQTLNAMLSLIQVTLSNAVTVTLSIIKEFFTGSILQILIDVWNLQTQIYPQYTYSFEKLIVGWAPLGEFINGIFVRIICVIVSEVEQGTVNASAVDGAYDQCLIDAQTIDPACIISGILNIGTRAIQVVFQLALGIFRVLNPINDDFKWAIWNPNILYDTIRNPLNLTISPFVSDPWVEKDNISTIQIPTIPGNGTIFTCNESFIISNETIVCTECALLGNISFETCFCDNFMTKADNLLFDVIHVRFLKPIFCGTLFQAVRVVVAVFKLVLDIIRTIEITPAPQVLNLLADPMTYDRVINEIGGPVGQIGGLIYFPNDLILALVPDHPDLECIPSLITYPAKAIVEVARLVLYFIQSFFADIRLAIPAFGVTNPFTSGTYLTNFLCVPGNGGENCANFENALQWLRIPRNSTLFYKNVIPLITISNSTIPGIYKMGAFECLCSIINLQFIHSFEAEIPDLSGFDIPDICCSIYNIGRAAVEYISFWINLVLSVTQTIFELTVMGNPEGRIFTLTYLACLTNTTGTPCSNVNAFIVDVTSILGCGCLTVEEIIDIPDIANNIGDTKPLYCLCNLFSAVTSVLGNSLIIIRDGGQTIIGIFDCINVTTGVFNQTPQCNIFLPNLVVEAFERLSSIVDLIGRALKEAGCLLSTAFYYDCLNALPVPDCLTIDFESCVIRNCPPYFANETIGNNIPTQPQFNDCVDQCGYNTCAQCLAEITFYFNSSNTSVFIGCPYGCSVPGKCRPNDKFPPLVRAIYNVIGNIIRLALKLITDVIVFAIQKATGVTGDLSDFPTTFTQYFNLFLDAIGNTLFGDTVHTWGFIQYLGDFLSCIIGPPNCYIKYTNTSPELGAPCFGNLFVVLGNLLGSFYNAIVDIVVSIVGMIEALISGDFGTTPGTGLAYWIKQFVVSLFRFLGVLLVNIQAIFNFVIGFVAGVLEFVLTVGTQSGGPVFDTLFDILHAIFLPIIDVLQGLVDILKFFHLIKRSEIGENKSRLEELVQNWTTFVNKTKITTRSDFYGSVKRFFEGYLNITELLQNSSQYSTGEEEYIATFKEKYNLTDQEFEIISTPSLLISLVNNGTYCYKIIDKLQNVPFASMSLFEEFAFKTCYSLVVIPILNNAKIVGSQIELPLDITYNIERVSSVISDLELSFKYFGYWNSPYTHMYSYIPSVSSVGKRKRNTDYSFIDTSNYNSFGDFIVENVENKDLISSFFKSTNYVDNYVKNRVNPIIDYSTNFSQFVQSNNIDVSTLKMTPPNKFSWSNNIDKIEQLLNYGADTIDSMKRTKQIGSLIYKYRSMAPLKLKKFGPNQNNNLYIKDKYKKTELLYKRYETQIKNINSRKINMTGITQFTGGDMWNTTMSIFTKSIPGMFNFWVKTSSNKRSAILNVDITNADKISPIGYLIRNIYVERSFLVMDSITTIFKHQLEKISNVTMVSLLSKSVAHLRKRSATDWSSNVITKRASLPERIVSLHSQIKKLKMIGKHIPDLPDGIVSLSDEMVQKRRLVVVNCSCNCSIVENFIQELVDISTYCYEKQVLNIPDPLYNGSGIYTGPIIKIVWYNASESYPFPLNYINLWTNVDLFATTLAFITTTNTDEGVGPIGLLYYIRRIPLPFITLGCTRLNLTCQLGVGLEQGILISMIIVFSVAVGLYIVSPPIAGVVNTLLVGLLYASMWIFFINLVLTISWGYQPNCYNSPTGSIITYLVPAIGDIPMLPECAANEIYNVVTKYLINPCPLDSFDFLGFKELVPPDETCLPCPEKINVTSCYDIGITSPLTIFGLFLLRYIPPLGSFFQGSVFVRGNWLGFLLGQSSPSVTNDGWLGSLFGNINTTIFLNMTDPTLEQCFKMNYLSIIPGFIALIVFVILVCFALIFSIDIIAFVVSLANLVSPGKDPKVSHYDVKGKRMFG